MPTPAADTGKHTGLGRDRLIFGQTVMVCKKGRPGAEALEQVEGLVRMQSAGIRFPGQKTGHWVLVLSCCPSLAVPLGAGMLSALGEEEASEGNH